MYKVLFETNEEVYKLMKNIFKHSGEYVVHSHDKKDYLKKESVEYNSGGKKRRRIHYFDFSGYMFCRE